MNIQTDITLAVFQSLKTVGGEGGWGERFKRPIDFRESESVTSPFCEGESQTQQGCHKRLYLYHRAEGACSEPRDGVETKYNFVNSILVY